MNPKYETLKSILASYGSVAIAFSGGVDSTLLLKAAKDALEDKVIAVTVKSAGTPKREIEEAMNIAEELGVTHLITKSNEMENEEFVQNPPERCYVCKKIVFSSIFSAARSLGITTVAEGSNVDDDADFRPGAKAVKEMEVKSPLHEAGLTKAEIRTISKELNLLTWDKQSYACLATRFPYGSHITLEGVEKADKAEQYLLENGFHQVRVRVHDNLARIEVSPGEMDKLYELSKSGELSDYFREIGFDYVSMDLDGYKTGSMNRTISAS